MNCNQGRDCPARRVRPYPHIPTESLPPCPCRAEEDDWIDAVVRVLGSIVGALVLIALVLGTASMLSN